LVAVTVNVYAVPLVKPETVIGEEEPVPVKPPGLEVTVYVKLAGKPVVGAVKVTDADTLPAVAVPIVGAPGFEGQILAAIACNCCRDVQIPLKLGILYPYHVIEPEEVHR
jgi:hypothetical protein